MNRVILSYFNEFFCFYLTIMYILIFIINKFIRQYIILVFSRLKFNFLFFFCHHQLPLEWGRPLVRQQRSGTSMKYLILDRTKRREKNLRASGGPLLVKNVGNGSSAAPRRNSPVTEIAMRQAFFLPEFLRHAPECDETNYAVCFWRNPEFLITI